MLHSQENPNDCYGQREVKVLVSDAVFKRIKKEGLAGKNYIFYRDGKREAVIPNKFGKKWWTKATKRDIGRVSAH